jgi:hypothetical protein
MVEVEPKEVQLMVSDVIKPYKYQLVDVEQPSFDQNKNIW